MSNTPKTPSSTSRSTNRFPRSTPASSTSNQTDLHTPALQDGNSDGLYDAMLQDAKETMARLTLLQEALGEEEVVTLPRDLTKGRELLNQARRLFPNSPMGSSSNPPRLPELRSLTEQQRKQQRRRLKEGGLEKLPGRRGDQAAEENPCCQLAMASLASQATTREDGTVQGSVVVGELEVSSTYRAQVIDSRDIDRLLDGMEECAVVVLQQPEGAA
jgi:hypothetical protein